MANPIVYGGVGSPQSVFDTTTTQYHNIGTRGHLDDRVFYYTRINGTAIGPNLLAQQAVPVANHVTETGTLTGFTAGSKSFTAVLGATASTANQYESGYFKIQSSTLGPGQLVKLNKHGAVASAGTATFSTPDTIVTTPTGTVTWSLFRNPWADPIVTPITTQTGINVGVPLVSTGTGTDADPRYCWMQTWGVCSVLGDTTNTVVGSGVLGQSATAGAVALELATTITQRPGVAMETLATDDVYQLVFLQIAP